MTTIAEYQAAVSAGDLHLASKVARELEYESAAMAILDERVAVAAGDFVRAYYGGAPYTEELERLKTAIEAVA